jgi:hypothetical protein
VGAQRASRVGRRLIVPVALVVTVIGTALAATTTAGCRSTPHVADASGDGVVDSPPG